MGNKFSQNSSNSSFSSTVVEAGHLDQSTSSDTSSSSLNYVMMNDGSTDGNEGNIRQKKGSINIFSKLKRFNCIQAMRNSRVPDWYNHMKHQAVHKSQYSGHEWANSLLVQVQAYSEYKDYQANCIVEFMKASQCSSFDSSEFIARKSNRLDSQYHGNVLDDINGQSSFLSEMSKQIITEREKKLDSIIENSELLRESVQEHRNTMFQRSHSRRSSISSETSDHGEDSQDYENLFSGLNQYKEMMRVLSQHIANTDKHPVGVMLSKFADVFSKQSIEQRGFLGEVSPRVLKERTEEINDFISFVVELIRIYYRLDLLLQNHSGSGGQGDATSPMLFMTLENLHNFVCSNLFQYEGFSRKILKTYSTVDLNIQEKFRVTVQNKKDQFTMKSLGIREEFHLGHIEEKTEIQGVPHPYQKAIEMIRNAGITKAPLQKLKIYLKIYDVIELCIRDYYQNRGQTLQVSCDADNFLGIIQYIIIRADAFHVYRDVKIIEAFVRNSSSKSASSYKLITLQGSVLNICSLSV